MDNVERFKEPTLPPTEALYSSLTGEHISEEDYQHAQNVFSSFNLRTLGEYHDLYLLTDVPLVH